jgi:asparagine synthase (glutamine-hydrolysing)
MCGIAGIYHLNGGPVDEQRLDEMTQALVHRGPDGFGSFCDGPVGLGHRRLSIIDPALGQQPMSNENSSVVVSFNGEIYNYKEIRTELKSLGYQFTTDSDTEVVLNAYCAWGEQCQTRFNGMWAFAIWDARSGSLFLSRDRVGEKPLFYAEHKGAVIFASEPKSLFAYGFPAELDHEYLEIYLTLGYVPAPYSFFKNVHKLEAGCSLNVSGKGVSIHRYWELPQVPEAEMRTDRDGVLEEFDYLLRDSVRLRMRSDVPFGAFLSGGLDSASIVALMSEHSDRVSTFTIGFEERAFDERALARLVARKFNTNHHEEVVGSKSFDDALAHTLQIYDEPFGDSSAIPSKHVCDFAAKHVKMVLTGDGGDEVLSGYPAYQAEKLGDMYQKVPSVVRRIVEGSLSAGAVTIGGDLKYKLQRLAGALKASGCSFQDRLIEKSSWADASIMNEVLEHRKNMRPVADYISETLSGCSFSDPFYKLMYFQYRVSLPERMLTKVDRVSMSSSLECRAPFLDHRLVEMMAGVSKSVKMPGSQRKYVLRETAGKLLPREILTGPKKGFVPPLRNWLNEEVVRKYIDSKITHQYGLNLDNLINCARLNETGEYDLGDFLWIILLLSQWSDTQTKNNT